MCPKPSAGPKAAGPPQIRAWCDETWPELYRYIYRRVQNREEAEDLTQETYSRTLGRAHPAELPPIGYLRTVALNLIRDRWHRRQVRGLPVPLTEAVLAATGDTDECVDRSAVRTALAALPPEYQTVLQLRIVEGYSRAETAERLGRSEDAVRGLQYRALQQLRDLLLNQFTR